jgi:hypothetical protein
MKPEIKDIVENIIDTSKRKKRKSLTKIIEMTALPLIVAGGLITLRTLSETDYMDKNVNEYMGFVSNFGFAFFLGASGGGFIRDYMKRYNSHVESYRHNSKIIRTYEQLKNDLR